MKKILALVLFAAASFGYANPIDDTCAEKVIWGAPQIVKEGNNQYICHLGYAVNYNYETKVAYFVVERIKASDLVKSSERKDDFRVDPMVAVDKQSSLEDYAKSGYDRGHIAPAADFSHSAEEISESFYLTNMMPQVPNNNRGIWKKTETMAREFAEKYGEVYVVSGTIYEGKKVVMGKGVLVPSHIYKIIIDPKKQRAMAFLFPNTNLKVSDLPNYVVTVADIEKRAGVNISPKLPANLSSLETTKAKIGEW